MLVLVTREGHITLRGLVFIVRALL